MANRQLVELLQRGPSNWNDWKKKNPGVKADLKGALLIGANLQGVDFSDADLSEAQLAGAYLDRVQMPGAILFKAKLFRAHLGAANFKNANLERADLGGTHLAGADLSDANLTESHLRGANLYGAILNGTNFHNAHVGRTVFGGLDLSVAKGVENMIHSEPSTIGLDTYLKSNGKIPAVFMQGAGLPEDFVSYLAGFSGIKAKSKG